MNKIKVNKYSSRQILIKSCFNNVEIGKVTGFSVNYKNKKYVITN